MKGKVHMKITILFSMALLFFISLTDAMLPQSQTLVSTSSATLTRPDFMPLACKALINLFNNQEKCAVHNIPLPEFIIIHGTAGNGKSTIINDMMMRINADPLYESTATLALQCDSSPTSLNANRIMQQLALQARIKAQVAKSPLAVIVLDKIDVIYKQELAHIAHLATALKYVLQLSNKPNDKNLLRLLIIGKTVIHPTYSQLQSDETIEIDYPSEQHRQKLATYFFNNFQIPYESRIAAHIAKETDGMSIREIALLSRRTAVLALTDETVTKNLTHTIDTLIHEMKHAGHIEQALTSREKNLMCTNLTRDYMTN